MLDSLITVFPMALEVREEPCYLFCRWCTPQVVTKLNFLSGINMNKSSKAKERQAPSVHPNPGISPKRHAPLQLYDSGW